MSKFCQMFGENNWFSSIFPNSKTFGLNFQSLLAQNELLNLLWVKSHGVLDNVKPVKDTKNSFVHEELDLQWISLKYCIP